MPLDHPTPLRAAARALRKLYGIEVPEYRLPLLALELEQLGGRGGHEQGLSLLLARDPRAWDRVIDAITVPETYMFRHLGHYLLIRKLAEERVARGRPMRVLCAGCSSGEEAWSAAAVLTTARGRASERDRVVGWDASAMRLAEAREGRYSEWSVRSGLHGYGSLFHHKNPGWEVSPALRPLARFSKVNLVGPLPTDEGPFDAILFRNVAIYWEIETAHAVVERLASLLAPDGILLVGPSDPAKLDPGRWEHVIAHGVRYFRAAPKPKIPPPAFVSRLRHNPYPVQPPVGLSQPATLMPPQIQAADALAEVKVLANAGRYAQALELLRATVGDASIEGRLWEGILLLHLGDTAGAIERHRQCVFLAPERASHRRWLAISYRAAGRIEEAEREQRNAEMVSE